MPANSRPFLFLGVPENRLFFRICVSFCVTLARCASESERRICSLDTIFFPEANDAISAALKARSKTLAE